MEIKQIVVSLGIGLLAGLGSGLFGIGGGVIIVPLLIYFYSMKQQVATATSLVALVLPVGILAIIKYYKAGFLQTDQIKIGLTIAVAMFAGALLGAQLATQIASQILTKAFSLFLIFVAIKLWFSSNL